jgi:hypothetical protein
LTGPDPRVNDTNRVPDTSQVDKADPDLGREARLEKIPAGQYQTVKNWELPQDFGPAPVLLLTVDGADFGIHRDSEFQKYLLGDDDELGGEQERGYSLHSGLEIPFRLVLNSSALIGMLEKITGVEMPARYPVHVRPFKFLLVHEVKIREAFDKLEKEAEHKSADTLGGATGTVDSSQANANHDQQKPSASTQNEHSSQEESPPVDDGLKATPRNIALLRTLVNFMDSEMRDIRLVREKIADRSVTKITFEYLCHLFKAGDLIWTNPKEDMRSRRA